MSKSSKSSNVTPNKSASAIVLSVLANKGHRPTRTTTGLNSLQYAELAHRNGVYKEQSQREYSCSYIEEKEHLIQQLQPLISDWSDKDRAILALRMDGLSIREIKDHIGVCGNRICSVIKKTKDFLQCP